MQIAQINQEIILSDELLNQIADLVVPIVMEKVKAQIDIWNKFIDLPPAPNKSQIKKTLGIGEDTLKYLMANGATPMVWGEGTIRIQRTDLIKAFEKTKLKD